MIITCGCLDNEQRNDTSTLFVSKGEITWNIILKGTGLKSRKALYDKIQFLSQNIKNTLVVKDKHAKYHCQLDIKSQRYIYTLETSWKANTFDRKRLIFSCSIREIFRPSYSWWKKMRNSMIHCIQAVNSTGSINIVMLYFYIGAWPLRLPY